jgi:cobalamin biosynthesis Mg chelatase CobN
MWPKMLLELLPHLSRLMPMADKYFSSRSVSDKAHEAALVSLTAEVRGGLEQISAAQEGFAGHLQEQSAQTAQLAVEVTRGRMAAETVEARVAALEKSTAAAMKLMWGSLALLVVVVTLLAIVLVRAGAH